MRIAIAELKQETNTFVPFTTTVKTFEDQYLYRGDEILTAFGKARLEVPGALDAINVHAMIEQTGAAVYGRTTYGMMRRKRAGRPCRSWPPWRWPRAWSSARASTS